MVCGFYLRRMIGKVLFVMEKYCDADPKCGPTNSESQLVGAIESTELVSETKHFYFDVLCQKLGKEKMGLLLIEDCKIFEPDLVIYTPIGGLLGYELNPTDGTLNEIRNRGMRLYTCLWDTEGREWETGTRWLPTADGVLVLDTVVRAQHYKNDPRIIQAYSAIDSRDFYNKGLERDIDVSFIGAVDLAGVRWPQRIQHINFLRSSGINIFVAGGQRQKRISWEEYSSLLNRSKISLNWALNPGTGTSQIKGRVFETMSCGAMLLEDDGIQTNEFFEPDEEFVTFHDQQDLLNKLHYYLAHDDERRAIAESGYEKATKIYNARNMWGHLFRKMGFKISDDLVADENFKKHEAIMEVLKC